jgi:hypothetical protein
MNDHQKLSAPLRGAEHYNQIEPSSNVRKTLDTTPEPNFLGWVVEISSENVVRLCSVVMRQ